MARKLAMTLTQKASRSTPEVEAACACSSTAGTPRLLDISEQDTPAVIQFQDAILPASDDEEGSVSEVDGRIVSFSL